MVHLHGEHLNVDDDRQEDIVEAVFSAISKQEPFSPSTSPVGYSAPIRLGHNKYEILRGFAA
jgi:hypothetical protein